MTNWYDTHTMQMSNMISEDVGAPELRSPRYGGMRLKRNNWFVRMLGFIMHS